jgi:hypothetical protein
MNNNQHPSVPGECHHELADLLDHLLNLPLGSQDEVEEWYETASSAEEFLETTGPISRCLFLMTSTTFSLMQTFGQKSRAIELVRKTRFEG